MLVNSFWRFSKFSLNKSVEYVSPDLVFAKIPYLRIITHFSRKNQDTST